jgi:hypothetical protein
MFPWYWTWQWAPQVHLPWSGSVKQDISPTTEAFFGDIPPGAGVGYLEKEAVRIASYGRQLGLISEVLLAQQPGTVDPHKAAQSLAELGRIHAGIEAVKRDTRQRRQEALIAEIEHLRQDDPVAFEGLIARYRPVDGP